MASGILLFLVGALADFFSFLLLTRFLMQFARVSFSGPLGEFVLILTNGMVRPLRRFIPGVLGLDWASLIPAWLIQAAVVLLGFALSPNPASNPLADLIPLALGLGAVAVLVLTVWVVMIALIAQALMSWINPYSPFAPTMSQLTRPILRPIQRFLPPIGGKIDLSPLVAILLLQVLLKVVEMLRIEIFLR